MHIYPDYTSVTLPYNIAPLNFKIEHPADEYLTVLRGEKKGEIVLDGKSVRIGLRKWRAFLAENRGASYRVEVYLRSGAKWRKLIPARNYVSDDPVDEYLSYRLIEPGYVHFNKLSIRQRNLTDFTESDVFNNEIYAPGGKKACINCHAYQNYRTSSMQFHAREIHGGTLIVNNGKVRKVNLKTGDLISGGVYPAWHPQKNLIAYSVNETGQVFHSRDSQKVEVQDLASDLILYDVEQNQVRYISNRKDQLETFPAWSPDGKTLYYASAHYVPEQENVSMDIILNYKKVRYNLYKRTFDAERQTFGEQELVFDAAALGKSATLPRVSPDGQFLLFTLGAYGNFHIWHKSSDLCLMYLEKGWVTELERANSNDVESYHSWSSNGRWVVYSSRRDDGSYTRPYLIHFDNEGRTGKPFVLPQEDPDFYGRFLKSFNIPEFTVEPVATPMIDFVSAMHNDPVEAKLQ